MTRFALAALICALAAPALAAEPVEIKLAIQDHKFEPAELKVPAGQKIKLLVENRDDTAEEFESHELNREKIVGPKATITVYIGPLQRDACHSLVLFDLDRGHGNARRGRVRMPMVAVARLASLRPPPFVMTNENRYHLATPAGTTP